MKNDTEYYGFTDYGLVIIGLAIVLGEMLFFGGIYLGSHWR